MNEEKKHEGYNLPPTEPEPAKPPRLKSRHGRYTPPGRDRNRAVKARVLKERKS